MLLSQIASTNKFFYHVFFPRYGVFNFNRIVKNFWSNKARAIVEILDKEQTLGSIDILPSPKATRNAWKIKRLLSINNSHISSQKFTFAEHYRIFCSSIHVLIFKRSWFFFLKFPDQVICFPCIALHFRSRYPKDCPVKQLIHSNLTTKVAE